MLQRPDDHYAVWHFWDGPDRDFVCWYLNLQTAFVRSPDGYSTQDLELDVLVFADGSHIVKDDELLDESGGRGTLLGRARRLDPRMRRSVDRSSPVGGSLVGSVVGAVDSAGPLGEPGAASALRLRSAPDLGDGQRQMKAPVSPLTVNDPVMSISCWTAVRTSSTTSLHGRLVSSA